MYPFNKHLKDIWAMEIEEWPGLASCLQKVHSEKDMKTITNTDQVYTNIGTTLDCLQELDKTEP